MRFDSTPLVRAAVADFPVARRSKPNRVRFSKNQYPTPINMEIKNLLNMLIILNRTYIV